MIEEISEQAWRDLENLIGKPPRVRPDGFGFTVSEYMERYGVGNQLAKQKLEEGIETGKMKKEEMLWHSTKAVVYYFLDEA